MRRHKGSQIRFEDLENSKFDDFKLRLEHGGGIRKGKRKLHRPFDSRRPVHLDLKSTQAKGTWSFLRPVNQKKINRLVYGLAERFGIRIFKFANSGNHLHLIVQGQKEDFKKFLRTLTALLARAITNARKGHPLKKRFWDNLAYTRLVTWGRELQMVKRYVTLNTLEAVGLLPQRRPGEKARKNILDLDLEGYLEERILRRQEFG